MPAALKFCPMALAAPAATGAVEVGTCRMAAAAVVVVVLVAVGVVVVVAVGVMAAAAVGWWRRQQWGGGGGRGGVAAHQVSKGSVRRVALSRQLRQPSKWKGGGGVWAYGSSMAVFPLYGGVWG